MRLRVTCIALILSVGCAIAQQQTPPAGSSTSPGGSPPAADTPSNSTTTPDDPRNYAHLPENFTTYVISVTDGNWVETEREGGHISVRLYGIVCPDRKTAVGQAAAQDLGRLVYGKFIHVKRLGYSTYGGIFGIVTVDTTVAGQSQTTEVNESMISRGWAVSRHFLDLPDIDTRYDQLEADAKEKKVGLWYVPGATVEAK